MKGGLQRKMTRSLQVERVGVTPWRSDKDALHFHAEMNKKEEKIHNWHHFLEFLLQLILVKVI